MKVKTVAILSSAILCTPLAYAEMDNSGMVGPQAGDHELTLSGTGSSDKHFDNGLFGVSGDLGWYLSTPLEVGIRQSISYANSENSQDVWNGATRGFVDYHFGTGRWRPFVGASLGGVYGESTNETGFAGPELGVKYYVRDKTFIFGRAEYQFYFDSSSDIDNKFNDGSFAYSVGLGYHF